MATVFDLWEVTPQEISAAILENSSLRGMVFGYVAELKLRQLLLGSSLISEAVKDDDHDRTKKGDLRVVYRGSEFKIESKSLQTAKNKTLADGTFSGVSQVDASDRRRVVLPDRTTLETTNLLVGEFDVLAVNCFSFENKWIWVFACNMDLPRSTFRGYTDEQRKHLLATTVTVTWPPTGGFTADVFALLDRLVAQGAPAPEGVVLGSTFEG